MPSGHNVLPGHDKTLGHDEPPGHDKPLGRDRPPGQATTGRPPLSVSAPATPLRGHSKEEEDWSKGRSPRTPSAER